MEVATLEVAKKPYSTPRELLHWHESRLLGSTEPANQLVAYVPESCEGLKVILDTVGRNTLHGDLLLISTPIINGVHFGSYHRLRWFTINLSMIKKGVP
jgi:hypothetical protein